MLVQLTEWREYDAFYFIVLTKHSMCFTGQKPGMKLAALREEFANSSFHCPSGGGERDQLELPKLVCCSVADNGLISISRLWWTQEKVKQLVAVMQNLISSPPVWKLK